MHPFFGEIPSLVVLQYEDISYGDQSNEHNGVEQCVVSESRASTFNDL